MLLLRVAKLEGGSPYWLRPHGLRRRQCAAVLRTNTRRRSKCLAAGRPAVRAAADGSVRGRAAPLVLSSFPSRAWERILAKLRFAAPVREAELPRVRSQAELG